VVHRIVDAKGGVNAEDFGIDYEAWAKQKEAYLKK
jgi:hypothetical protein